MNNSTESSNDWEQDDSFEFVVEGWLVPIVSAIGLFGNSVTVLVLNNRKVQLKKTLVDILCGLAVFDNAFLICVFFLFTLPCLSSR